MNIVASIAFFNLSLTVSWLLNWCKLHASVYHILPWKKGVGMLGLECESDGQWSEFTACKCNCSRFQILHCSDAINSWKKLRQNLDKILLSMCIDMIMYIKYCHSAKWVNQSEPGPELRSRRQQGIWAWRGLIKGDSCDVHAKTEKAKVK